MLGLFLKDYAGVTEKPGGGGCGEDLLSEPEARVWSPAPIDTLCGHGGDREPGLAG